MSFSPSIRVQPPIFVYSGHTGCGDPPLTPSEQEAAGLVFAVILIVFALGIVYMWISRP